MKEGRGRPKRHRPAVVVMLLVAMYCGLSSGISMGGYAEQAPPEAEMYRPPGDEGHLSRDASLLPPARVLHFPKHRFMGLLYIRDAADPSGEGYLREGGFDRYWEHLGDAQGDVAIPAGKQVYLHMYKPVNLSDLSPLDSLRPDDLRMLSIACDGLSVRADDAILPYVGRLTGLNGLDLRHVSITARGAQHLRGLQSLTHLKVMTEDLFQNAMGPSRQMDDDCLPILAGMESLEVLNLSSNGITDPGLAGLAGAKSLRELKIWSNRLRGPGLAHLSKIPSLRSLGVGGMAMNDSSLPYLAGLKHLKRLDLGGMKITDAGLAHLSGMIGLEDLNLYNTHVTEKGMVHLSPLTSLKLLKLGKGPGNPTKIGEGALVPLRNIKSFEHLDFSNCGLTDEDLASLAGCTKLRFFCGDSSKQNPISDTGLAHLAALPALEELRISGEAIGDVGMEHVAGLKNLKVLSFRRVPRLTNAGLANLRSLTSLTRLDILRSEEITVGGLSQLNDLTGLEELRVRGLKRDGEVLDLSNLKQLKSLVITSGKEAAITDEDLVCLSGLTSLEEIQFAPHDLLSNHGLEHLSDLTQLSILNIGGPYITDEGLRALSDMENLFHLTLTGNFSDEGLRHLEGLRRLGYLRLVSGRNISKRAQARLQSRLPRLLSFVANQDREIRWDVMPPRPRDLAPPLRVQTLDGETIDLRDLRGKAVLLHFWATWCRPCVASMPALMDFQKHLSRHKDFVMISLSMDDYEEPLRKHLDEHKPGWPQARIGLKSRISADYGVNDGAPAFILIAPDGKIRLQNERNWDTIASAVEAMLGRLPETTDAGNAPPAPEDGAVGPLPGNAATTEARLPVLGSGSTEAVLNLATGELIDAQADNLRALAAQTAGDLVYMRSGNSAALVGLRGATLRRWADGRLSGANPDAQVESTRVYFVQQVPCAFRIMTVERDSYDLRVLSVEENAARIEFWKAGEGDPPG